MSMTLSSERKPTVNSTYSTILLKLIMHIITHTRSCTVMYIYVYGDISACIGKSVDLHIYKKLRVFLK